MDLRIVKTKKSIKNAFLELRKKKPLERITVRELSEAAMINKTTFYLHYSDMYELADEIENDTIQKIFNELPCLDSLFTNPAKLTKEIVTAFYNNHDIISTLFWDIRSAKLVDKVEQEVKKRTLKDNSSVEEQLMLTFLVQGAFHTAIKYKNESVDKVCSEIARITEIIIKSYARPY